MFRPLLLACLLLLSACGFRPLYGDSQAEQHLATVAIDNMEGQSGQHLRLLLTDRFYGAASPVTPQWRLKVGIRTSKSDLGISSDDVATRARLTLIATFTLTPVGDSTSPALSGSERSFVSYNILTDPYATEAAEANALERGHVQLADLIASRVALYLTGRQTAASPPDPEPAR